MSPRAGAAADDDLMDDRTVELYVQQFLDEWHFRVLHSGLAYGWDRSQAVLKALELFEASGMVLTPQEREALVNQEDDRRMIEGMVAKMPVNMKKTIEHLLLQMQLVLSTATRVRSALEEGQTADVARIMEDGDTGISQQILKDVVIQAGKEVGEIREVHNTWMTNMSQRIGRLTMAQEEGVRDEVHLEEVQKDLLAFRGKQNSKSTQVMKRWEDAETKMLVRLSFSGWLSVQAREKADRELNDSYTAELKSLNEEIKTFKKKQKQQARAFLSKRGDEYDQALLKDVAIVWSSVAREAKVQRLAAQKVAEAEKALNDFKDHQKKTVQSHLSRLAESVEKSLLYQVLQAWVTVKEDEKLERLHKQATEAMDARLLTLEVRAKSSVLEMMRHAFGDDLGHGYCAEVLECWHKFYLEEKRIRDTKALLESFPDKLKDLAKRQRGNALKVAAKSNAAVADAALSQVFSAWWMDVEVEKVIRYYLGKMDSKKHQLEAVQQMFKSFASQLEQGIGNSPRARKAQ